MAAMMHHVIDHVIACPTCQMLYVGDEPGKWTRPGSLGTLARSVGLVEPRTYRPGNDAAHGNQEDALDSIVIDAEELARLLE